MKTIGLLFFVAFATPLLAEKEIVLIDPAAGIAAPPIVIYPGAPPRTRDAAVTLADYVEKTLGVRPDVREGAPNPIPGHAIWVGYQPALDDLFPETDFDFHHPEETLIAARGNHVVVAGRDRWDPDHMEAKGRLAMITDRQQEYGTANAVYTFIRDQLANWDRAAEMRETFPEFAINWQPVFRKPENKWMTGLHPDHPLSGVWKREFETEGLE